MRNKRFLIFFLFVIVIVVIALIIKVSMDNGSYVKFDNVLINEIVPENYNQTDEEKAEINEFGYSVGFKGDSQLYEVQEDSYNMKIVTVKPSIKYKVAFSGMINNSLPKIDEIDSVVELYHPKYAGIWIDEDSRENILKLIAKIANSDYFVDDNGYLKIKSKNSQNEYDKKIEKVIYGEKLYILSVSSVCYIVDDVSGEVLDYNFEMIDKYQNYDYFEDKDKMIIFITENKDKQLEDTQIIQSIVELLTIM